MWNLSFEMTLTQEQLAAHTAIQRERTQGLRLSMVRSCAELSVRQCLEFAPATEKVVEQRVDLVMEEILAATKQTFYRLHAIDDKAARRKLIKDSEPQAIAAPLDVDEPEDRSVDTLSRTVLANLNSVTRTSVDNIERYEVAIQTMVEDESLVLGISRVELPKDSVPNVSSGVQYSIDFALRTMTDNGQILAD